MLHSRAIGVVTVMARAEPEADCRMVLETRHDYGDDLDAYENVIVKASGLAVVEELSIRCAVHWLVSEECLPLAVHPRSRPEGRRTESLPPSQPLTLSHSASTGTVPRPTRQGASQPVLTLKSCTSRAEAQEPNRKQRTDIITQALLQL